MATPFLSSEEYDERAHQLYNEGQYDDALVVLREGLMLYPNSVELHIGVGYAELAREEYVWARRSFERALVLEPEHEDALAGLGETLLKLGQPEAAIGCFRSTLELGYNDDVDLMLQIGRSLFREGSLRENTDLFGTAKEFFGAAIQQVPDSAEAVACHGYAQHRLGDDEGAIASLRRSLQLDVDHAEARIYLANILYDQGELEAALYHFERTKPEDHWDELGIWRVIELKQTLYGLEDSDPEIKPWDDRLNELDGDLDDLDAILAEMDRKGGENDGPPAEAARGQLELFGALLSSLIEEETRERNGPGEHQIVAANGRQIAGSWDEIVRRLRDQTGNPTHTMEEFMSGVSQHGFRQAGVRIPTHDAESFIRGSATAGLLRIVR